MKHIATALPLAFAAFLSVLGAEVRTNAPIEKVVHPGTRVWISSFALSKSPITVSIDQQEWPLVDGTKCTPDIPLDLCRHWRTNYAVFRQFLISAAEKAHLESTSLSKVLPELNLQRSQIIAMLPVQVHLAEVKGELAWVVTYYWENVEFAEKGGLGHIMSEAFDLKTLKLVWSAKCD